MFRMLRPESIMCVGVVAVALAMHGFATRTARAANAERTPSQVFAKGNVDECKVVLKRMAEERQTMIRELTALLKNGGQEKRSDVTTRYAILALGKLKAIESLEVIISKLGFTEPEEEGLVVVVGLGPLGNEQYPAIGALMELGSCVVDSVLQAVAEGKVEGEQAKRNAGFVLVTVLPTEEAKKRVLAYASTLTDKTRRERVLSKEILVYFDEDTAGPKPNR